MHISFACLCISRQRVGGGHRPPPSRTRVGRPAAAASVRLRPTLQLSDWLCTLLPGGQCPPARRYKAKAPRRGVAWARQWKAHVFGRGHRPLAEASKCADHKHEVAASISIRTCLQRHAPLRPLRGQRPHGWCLNVPTGLPKRKTMHIMHCLPKEPRQMADARWSQSLHIGITLGSVLRSARRKGGRGRGPLPPRGTRLHQCIQGGMIARSSLFLSRSLFNNYVYYETQRYYATMRLIIRINILR